MSFDNAGTTLADGPHLHATRGCAGTSARRLRISRSPWIPSAPAARYSAASLRHRPRPRRIGSPASRRCALGTAQVNNRITVAARRRRVGTDRGWCGAWSLDSTGHGADAGTHVFTARRPTRRQRSLTSLDFTETIDTPLRPSPSVRPPPVTRSGPSPTVTYSGATDRPRRRSCHPRQDGTANRQRRGERSARGAHRLALEHHRRRHARHHRRRSSVPTRPQHRGAAGPSTTSAVDNSSPRIASIAPAADSSRPRRHAHVANHVLGADANVDPTDFACTGTTGDVRRADVAGAVRPASTWRCPAAPRGLIATVTSLRPGHDLADTAARADVLSHADRTPTIRPTSSSTPAPTSPSTPARRLHGERLRHGHRAGAIAADAEANGNAGALAVSLSAAPRHQHLGIGTATGLAVAGTTYKRCTTIARSAFPAAASHGATTSRSRSSARPTAHVSARSRPHVCESSETPRRGAHGDFTLTDAASATSSPRRHRGDGGERCADARQRGRAHRAAEDSPSPSRLRRSRRRR